MDVTFNFQNKKVIVTGAAGMLGNWIVEAFSNAGAELWIVDINKEKLNKIVDRLTCWKKVNTSCFDLRNAQEIKRFFEEVKQTWGSADILINNAGIYPSGKLINLETEIWDDVMSINVRAPYLMSKAFSKLLIDESKPGSIVNMISKSAKVPRIGAIHYAMSKASLEMMTRGMGMELAPNGIRVNAVSPGFAPGSDTSFLSNEYIEAMKRKIPLGRTSGTLDAPQAIMFLCSNAANFITGTSMYVDGGNSAGDFNIPIINNG